MLRCTKEKAFENDVQGFDNIQKEREREGGMEEGVQQLAARQQRNSESPRHTRWYKTTGRQIWARLTAEVERMARGGRK